MSNRSLCLGYNPEEDERYLKLLKAIESEGYRYWDELIEKKMWKQKMDQYPLQEPAEEEYVEMLASIDEAFFEPEDDFDMYLVRCKEREKTLLRLSIGNLLLMMAGISGSEDCKFYKYKDFYYLLHPDEAHIQNGAIWEDIIDLSDADIIDDTNEYII